MTTTTTQGAASIERMRYRLTNERHEILGTETNLSRARKLAREHAVSSGGRVWVEGASISGRQYNDAGIYRYACALAHPDGVVR